MDSFLIVPILRTGSYIKCPKFWPNLEFLDIFLYKAPVSNFTEIRSLGATLRCAGRWTDKHRNRDGKQQLATVQTRLQLFSKPINACRSSKFVTLKYSEPRAFAFTLG